MKLAHYWGLELPVRTQKPRDYGLTMISDKGLGCHTLQDTIEVAGDFIDLTKFSIGSAVITGSLQKKLQILRDSAIRPYFGGTTFEKFYTQGKLDAFLEIHRRLGVDLIEVSDGTVQIPDREKFAIIERFAKEFTVVAEVGCKDECVAYACEDWIHQIRGCLAAGAWKVTIEGRESGTAGIYRATGETRCEIVDIAQHFDVKDIIIEAPKGRNQIDQINRFGPNVNLGNIAPAEVLVLESQRLGLRYDTF